MKDKAMVRIGMASCGIASGAVPVYEELRSILAGESSVEVKRVGCVGLCFREPLVEVDMDGVRTIYGDVTPEFAAQIARSLLKGELPENHIVYSDKAEAPENAVLDGQMRIVLKNSGIIDPEDMGDYVARGGYKAAKHAISEMQPEKIIETIEESSLRGRGGGGFPTGRKWRACREAEGDIKYVIANGDEGDPGAFMDRSFMEGDPHSVVEGMIIGAYAVGAGRGFIYVRNEYPLAVKRLSKAIEDARRAGFLGRRIFGSGFSFDIEICRGGGAFVCGESSALMRSIEGLPGVPRVKYIHATEKGLWDSPTILNNVETWANVPTIIEKGPEWFRSIGTEGSPGTKVFSLVGKVKKSGLIEVPMGMTLKSVIFSLGGGILKDRIFKAVQTGGPSGGCLPASLLDLPVDFDTLSSAGSMMGSGGMIVMDERTCMVDVARYFIDFLSDESCGKCVPCREGLKAIQKVLHDLTGGRGRKGDDELLKDMAERLAETALCGLGKTAANPVLSTLRYFPEEYAEHEDGYCRAGVCRGLFVASIDEGLCVGCGSCKAFCPAGAISGSQKEVHRIKASACIGCGSCLDACPVGAISAARRDAP